MIKKLIKFVLMSFLSFITMIVFFLILAALMMGPRVEDNSVLVLEISGPLLEQGPQNWKERLLVGEVLTTRNIISSLQKAKNDNRIKALLVKSFHAYLGPAKGQEVRSAIKDFADSTKKPVFGFVENGGTLDYYICSSAPRLYMPPEADSWFMLLGVRAEVPFFKGTFDKLGVVAQYDHVGAYKSGSEMYTRDSMSEANREETNALLESLYSRITSDIARDRKITPETLRVLIDQGPLIPTQFKAQRLVDDLLYEDELDELMKKQLKMQKLHKVSMLEYQKPTFTEAFDQKKDRIAILYASGTIMPGDSSKGIGEDVLGSETITDALQQIRRDDSIKAVVFRVDSPGGSPAASDLIWREVKVTAKKKPVVVSMADVAASGGYYIAMGASRILADPSTITGSIGVYGGKFYLKGLYDKIGMTKEIVKKGEHADLFSDYVPFDDQEWGIVHKQMKMTYDTFTRKAAEGRKKKVEQIDAVAQGRVWSGDQALPIGLIDRIGGLKEAIQEAKKLAKVQDVSFAIYPAARGGWGDVFTDVKVQLPKELTNLMNWDRISRTEHLLLFMPYRIDLN
jgi:protease-4